MRTNWKTIDRQIINNMIIKGETNDKSGTIIVIAMLARTCSMLSALISPKSMARSTIILTVSPEWQRDQNSESTGVEWCMDR